MIRAAFHVFGQRAVRQPRRIDPRDTHAEFIEQLAQLLHARLCARRFLDHDFAAQPRCSIAQIRDRVVPEMTAANEEGREVRLLVHEREHAHADATGQTVQHCFRERLRIVRRAYSSGLQQDAQSSGA